jgi:hypothetical protein
MDLERKRRLDEIGFVFSAQDNIWNGLFKKLHDYYEIHGHCELLWAVDRFPAHIEYPH